MGNIAGKPPQLQLVLKAPATWQLHLEDMLNEFREIKEM